MQNFITKSTDLALTFYLNYKQNVKPFKQNGNNLGKPKNLTNRTQEFLLMTEVYYNEQ